MRNARALPAIIMMMMVVVFILSGCSESPRRGKSAITDVLYENIKATQNEDMQAVMATMHTQSPVYESTKSSLRKIFARYDLKYNLESMDVVSRSKNSAKVRVVQVTKKVSGPAFRDNQVTMLDTLRKENGEWKLYSSKPEHIDYLK